MKILIAEDDLTSRMILEEVLKKWNYSIISVENGEDAWNQLSKPDSPKLAILDWMMPKISGVEVCRRVRSLDSVEPTYIIMLTARGQKEDIANALNAGAEDYLIKPFDNEELRARINVGQRVVDLRSKLAQRVTELEDALDKVKTLEGFIPICCHCKCIRDDTGYWKSVEAYIGERSEAEFSHGICPDCLKKHYGKYL